MIEFKISYGGSFKAARNMNGSSLQKAASILRYISAIVLALGCLNFLPAPSFAADCEILKKDMFERAQSAIVTDWNSGIPYRRLVTEVYPCASLLIRNSGWVGAYSTDIEVTAIFDDGSMKSKKIEDEKKRIEPGREYTCSVCFESSSPISKLECRFR